MSLQDCGEVMLSIAPIKERVMTAAVKVLDECLRAISGFKGTEDLSNDKSLDSPFTSDFVKTKAITSAPSYSLESPVSTNGDSKTCLLASERWLEATIKHMPLLVNHSSAMVRITASWAIANICDSLGHCLDALHAGRGSIDSMKCSEFTSLLVESALRLARDNGKIKANAVRGLGNLARSIQFTKQLPVHGDPLDSMNSKFEYPDTQGSKAHMKKRSHLFPTSSGGSDWLDQIVQAFLSCVTTGNVKVQWNVCHALSNLFLNKSLKLQDMDWVSSVFSILLLLLRNSSNFKIRIQAAAALAVPETIKGLTIQPNLYDKILIHFNSQKVKDTYARHNAFDFKNVASFDRSLINAPGPCVLFATPGMISGGFSLEVLRQWAPYEDYLVILSGYCLVGSIGHKLMSTKIPTQVKLDEGPNCCAMPESFFRNEAMSVIAEVNEKDIAVGLPGGLRGLVCACDAFDPVSNDEVRGGIISRC